MPTEMYTPPPKQPDSPSSALPPQTDASSLVVDEIQEPATDDWLTNLNAIRQEAEQVSKPTVSAKKTVHPDPDDLLKRVKALHRLRDIQKVVLKGQAMIQKFEQVDPYQLILALLWRGTIVNPSRPRVMGEAEQCIFIGVSKQYVYVNGQKISPTSPDGLQKQLLGAIKNPTNLKSEHILADEQATYEE
ncbi:hypothetical protein QUF64_07300 [Anaerolineales bacterium HSG6]|nr:hypothetical protein [Anaerolineales bacterium HSG6]MDM8532538.1 hypothetical protein [Anaerolineales bacterium HSG25]